MDGYLCTCAVDVAFEVLQVAFQLLVCVYRPGLDGFAGRVDEAEVEGLSWGVFYAQTFSDFECLFSEAATDEFVVCLLYTSPSPRD